MIDDRQEELAALEAFDLLEGAEKAQFEGEMARDPELRRRVQELREAAVRMAHLPAPPAPPDSLKDRVLASADHRKQVPLPAPSRVARIIPFPVLLAWGVAACLALVAGGVSQLYFTERTRNATLRDQTRLADLQIRSLETRFEADHVLFAGKLAQAQRESDLAQMKIATLASMLGNSPQAMAVAVWNPAKQEGVLAVDRLPVAAVGHDYELWVIPPGEKAAPIAAGLVRMPHGSGHLYFKADKPIASVAKFAVTLEVKGGVPAPAGSLVMISQ